jgi:hypothetical protein
MKNRNNPIDTLGDINAEIKRLKELKELLREEIEAMGQGTHEGEEYQAEVSSYDKGTLDMKAVRAKLSHQFIRANTNTISVTNVKVTRLEE